MIIIVRVQLCQKYRTDYMLHRYSLLKSDHLIALLDETYEPHSQCPCYFVLIWPTESTIWYVQLPLPKTCRDQQHCRNTVILECCDLLYQDHSGLILPRYCLVTPKPPNLSVSVCTTTFNLLTFMICKELHLCCNSVPLCFFVLFFLDFVLCGILDSWLTQGSQCGLKKQDLKPES